MGLTFEALHPLTQPSTYYVPKSEAVAGIGNQAAVEPVRVLLAEQVLKLLQIFVVHHLEDAKFAYL